MKTPCVQNVCTHAEKARSTSLPRIPNARHACKREQPQANGHAGCSADLGTRAAHFQTVGTDRSSPVHRCRFVCIGSQANRTFHYLTCFCVPSARALCACGGTSRSDRAHARSPRTTPPRIYQVFACVYFLRVSSCRPHANRRVYLAHELPGLRDHPLRVRPAISLYIVFYNEYLHTTSGR